MQNSGNKSSKIIGSPKLNQDKLKSCGYSIEEGLDQHSAYPLIFGDLEKIESVMAANLTDHAWSVAELLKFKNKNLTVKLDHQPNM